MMKKISIGIALCLIIIAVAGYYILTQTLLKPKPVHYHAGFQVYVDDKLQDFSDFKYMHEKPCTLNGKPVDDHDDEQIEKAHLHDQIGDVVHVHRSGATWGDLFINLKYPLDEKQVVAYVHGVKADNILKQTIKSYDSLVLFIGKHTDDKKYLEKAVTKDYIQKVEKKSEFCSS